ncbi:MAG: hypothetical protein ACP5P6_05835 [Candidatus Saccharicenans sp.]
MKTLSLGSGIKQVLNCQNEILKLMIINLLIAIFSFSPALATTFQFSLAHNSTNNIFQSYQPVSDQITTAGLSFGGDSSSVTLYGNLDLNYLYRYSELSSFDGKLGADYLVPIGQKSAFYFALEGEAVIFRSLYDYFNNGTGRFIANFKGYLSGSTIFRIDTISQYKNYKYGIFDNLSENVSMSLNQYFSSRTTIKIEANYGYKYYLHPGLISTTGTTSTSALTGSGTYSLGSYSLFENLSSLGAINEIMNQGSIIASSMGQQGMGRGNPKDNYKNGGKYSISGVPYQTVYYTGGKSIQIMALSGLISQGLGDHLEASFSGTKQWYLKGENPFSSSDEIFMVENPTYDQFSWQGYALKAKLAAELSDKLHSEFQYDYFSKEFPGITSLDLSGNSLGITRQDTRHQFTASLELNLSRVSFFVNYYYIKNSSNDPWYTWNGSIISGGLTWSLGSSK